MSRQHGWAVEFHDPILRALHGMGLNDYEIQERMLMQGIRFSASTVATHRKRLGLKLNPMPRHMAQREPIRPVREKANPLTIARGWLGKRLVEKPTGYFLDGIPANLETIMRACNQMRANTGEKQIDCNTAWVIRL